MLIKLFKDCKIPLINVVRREEQVKLLKEEYGAEIVLNSSKDNFYEELADMAKSMKATVCIECIGGPTTGKLMECLPSRSRVLYYGALSEKGPSEIDCLLMIGRSYTLESFILGHYLINKGIGALSVISKCNKLMQNELL